MDDLNKFDIMRHDVIVKCLGARREGSDDTCAVVNQVEDRVGKEGRNVTEGIHGRRQCVKKVN